MKIENGSVKRFLIVICISLVIGANLCDAGKDNKKHDKHKHKQESNHKDENKHHKNSTTGHHHNHTSAHVPSHDETAHNNPQPDIGWSLHNNPNHPPPASNPHGYAVQHHDSGHGAPSNHGPQQPVAGQSQVPSESSGPSALASGMGGMALGAIGGAAGGYMLSNALNSGKSGEKKDEEETTIISETTLAALVDTSTVSVVAESTSVPSDASESSSTLSEATKVAEEVVSMGAQKAPAEVVTAQSETTTEWQSTTSKGAISQIPLVYLVVMTLSVSLAVLI